MKLESKQKQDKTYLYELDAKVQKLKTSMLYYFKSKQSRDNLLMFIMDI